MNYFRPQYIDPEGSFVHPVLIISCNFSHAAEGEPVLLSHEEVTILYHEFGHALHGLLSTTQYPLLSGTATPRDFVELPSQIMENWARPVRVSGRACCSGILKLYWQLLQIKHQIKHPPSF